MKGEILFVFNIDSMVEIKIAVTKLGFNSSTPLVIRVLNNAC